MHKLLNSKWTSIEKKNGWKHFQVKNVYKNKKSIELFAVCDKKISFIIKMVIKGCNWMWRMKMRKIFIR